MKGIQPYLRLLTRPGAVTVQRDRLEWARYDLAGRWRAAMAHGLEYRQALSGHIIAIRYYLENNQQDGFHDVTEVSPEQAADLHATIQVWAAEAHDVFAAQLPQEWREALARARAIGMSEITADQEAFRRVYTGDPILPPDQRNVVLLQSTTGCAHNACTFCVFYRGTRFSIRSASAFAEHVEAVRQFLGPTLPSVRRIFLGDASALMVRPSLLKQHLQAAAGLLPPRPPGENPGTRTPLRPASASGGRFAAFCDAFLTPLHPVADLRELASLGLGRVYLGIESGSQELLDFLNKPATSEGMVAAVRALKEAGIHVSPIVMVGVGGQEFARVHREETLALLRRMPLGSGDTIQFSEFFCMPGSTYEQDATRQGLHPMSRSACRAETKSMIEALGLCQLQKDDGLRAQMYDARQLLY